ncbi:hypothetical protein MRX96_021996 [Rhipicephalus microplus]
MGWSIKQSQQLILVVGAAEHLVHLKGCSPLRVCMRSMKSNEAHVAVGQEWHASGPSAFQQCMSLGHSLRSLPEARLRPPPREGVLSCDLTSEASMLKALNLASPADPNIKYYSEETFSQSPR